MFIQLTKITPYLNEEAQARFDEAHSKISFELDTNKPDSEKYNPEYWEGLGMPMPEQYQTNLSTTIEFDMLTDYEKELTNYAVNRSDIVDVEDVSELKQYFGNTYIILTDNRGIQVEEEFEQVLKLIKSK